MVVDGWSNNRFLLKTKKGVVVLLSARWFAEVLASSFFSNQVEEDFVVAVSFRFVKN